MADTTGSNSSKNKKKNGRFLLIKKSNDLIESRFKFDIWETRTFLYLLSKIHKDDMEFTTYRLWYREMKEIFDINSNSSYMLMRKAVSHLMLRTFKVGYETNAGISREREYHIIRYIDSLVDGQEPKITEEVIRNQEYIDVTIEPEMRPLLLQLSKNYTAYDLRNVAKLGANPIRLYELLKQYETIGNRKLEIDEMKRMLELEKEYPNFGQFNQSFIRPAVSEINNHTDLYIYHIDQIKRGRRVIALHFHFRKRERNNEASTNDAEYIIIEPTAPHKVQKPSKVEEADTFLKNASPPADSENFDALFEKLNEWWGVEKAEFRKRFQGKTDQDVEDAIQFTKSRLKIGKASNPAGVFLDALSNGRIAPERAKEKKKIDRIRLQEERATMLLPLVEAYEQLLGNFIKSVNSAIREITEQNPEITGNVIAEIKSNYLKLGDRSIVGKTIEDFRQEPILRSLVKAEIMKKNPEIFETINADFDPRIAEARKNILDVDPTFVFK